MRKLFVVFLSVICVFSATVNCFAATEVPTENKGSESIDVVADYVKNTSDPKRVYCEITDGKAGVTVADGVTVSVSDVRAEGLTLVVLPITKAEEEAWNWIEACLGNRGKSLYPMDIYFIDENGNRVEYNATFSVSITTPDRYTAPSVFYISTDGQTTEISCIADGNTVSFETDHSSYYTVAEKIQNTSDKPTSPPTGDNIERLLPIALILLCVICFAVISIIEGKKATTGKKPR